MILGFLFQGLQHRHSTSGFPLISCRKCMYTSGTFIITLFLVLNNPNMKFFELFLINFVRGIAHRVLGIGILREGNDISE